MKTIYLCGPTVYDYPHLGNLKPVVTMDFILRAYKSIGEEIFYVHNITDIDDKIINKAIETNVSEKEISEKYIKNYLTVLNDLNIIMPNEMPKVSDHIEEMITFITRLINTGAAYVQDGTVYFDTKSTKGYGTLSNQKMDMMLDTHSDNKKNPQDFALWKKTNIGLTWKSPWSNGRPGWHTECSVFVDKYFDAKTLDIHAGGIDLKFPHHENENIQYLAINKKAIAKNWIHFGHLFIEEEKMSKSIGNIINADKFIQKFGSNILRLIFALTNPLGPMKITDKLLADAKKLNNKLEKIYHVKSPVNSSDMEFAQEIIKLNFAKAMAMMHQELKIHNKGDINNIGKLKNMIQIWGLSYKSQNISKSTQALLNEWQEEKSKKNYKKADEIRKILRKMNVI